MYIFVDIIWQTLAMVAASSINIKIICTISFRMRVVELFLKIIPGVLICKHVPILLHNTHIPYEVNCLSTLPLVMHGKLIRALGENK